MENVCSVGPEFALRSQAADVPFPGHYSPPLYFSTVKKMFPHPEGRSQFYISSFFI